MNKHIVLISGSGTLNAKTTTGLTYIAKLLRERGMRTTLWDLAERPLPIAIPEEHGNMMHPDPVVREFIRLVDSADGIVLGTPLYHGSFSGILKNALDNLGGDGFKNKHVGLLSNAGGAGDSRPLEQLRSIVRNLYGYALQTQIATSGSDFSDAIIGRKVTSAAIKDRCARLADELVMFVTIMKGKTAVQ